jgi:hypothetical protein
MYANWLNKKPISRDSALVNYDFNAATPDVAILGSSTAICHYDPDIIHDSLFAYYGKNYEVFNMGVSNQRLAYDYYGLKSLLERTKPYMVIVDVWSTFIGEKGIHERYEAFKPYIYMNPVVKEMFAKHNKLDVIMKSKMYCFNTELVYLLMAPFFNSDNVNGFSKSKTEMTTIVKETEKDTTALCSLSVEEFDAMIELAHAKNVSIIVVLSPTLCSSDTTSLSYQYMKKKCAESGVLFLDYSNDETYYTPPFV